MKGIKSTLTKHIENNIIKYITALTVFAAGLVIGVVNCLGTSADGVGAEIQSVFESMPEVEFDTGQILSTSFFKNVRHFLLIFIGGFSMWLTPLPFGVLFTCGFSYGFTVACITAQMGAAGFAMAFVSIILNLIITIPFFMVLTVFAFNRSAGKGNRRKLGTDVTGYAVCFTVLFILNLVVVAADALLIPKIIQFICASVKL